jgi:hypothetical protein
MKSKKSKIRKTRKLRQKGGVTTFVGAPLIYKNISSWPHGHDGNHYLHNNYNNDPQLNNIINEREVYIPNIKGGYFYKKSNRTRSKSRSRRRKSYIGGYGPLIGDLVNATRSVATNIGNNYNTLNGYPQTVSPLPYLNQFNTK